MASEEERASSEQEEEIEHSEGSVQQIEANLFSMENLDRSSPELWPEKFPEVAGFLNNCTPPPQNASKMPYSRELSVDDQNYLHQLATLPVNGIVSKVKELHDIAYQLGVEETKEIKRGMYLNLFSKGEKK